MSSEKLKKKSLANLADYKFVFSSPQGEKVLFDLMKMGNMLSTTHMYNDPTTTSYNEGRRAIVLDIIRKLKVNEKQLIQIYDKGIEYESEWD